MCYQSNRNTMRTVGLDTLSIYSKPGMNVMKNALTRHENIVSFKEEEEKQITNNSIMSRCGHNIWDKLWFRMFMHGHTYKSTISVYAQTHIQKHSICLCTDTLTKALSLHRRHWMWTLREQQWAHKNALWQWLAWGPAPNTETVQGLTSLTKMAASVRGAGVSIRPWWLGRKMETDNNWKT